MFKSFYKIRHSKIFLDKKQYNNTTLTTPNNLDTVLIDTPSYPSKYHNTNVLTTNLLVAFVTLFSVQYTNTSKRKAHNSSIVNLVKQPKFLVSFFFLPIRKKNVIFLRAPYKNKMARLNILNLEYTLIMSLRSQSPQVNNLPATNPLISQFSRFNLSSSKLKHVKTTLSMSYSAEVNFKIFSYLNRF